MARAAQSEAVECPRCGYDVSGVMSLWKTECPVEGRCSECGYVYQWKHLLGANRDVPRWFFEHRRRARMGQALSTCRRTLIPWRFWREIPLHALFFPWRIVVMVVGVWVAAYATIVLWLSMQQAIWVVLPGIGRGSGHYRWRLVPGASVVDRVRFFWENDLLEALQWPRFGSYGMAPETFGAVHGIWALATVLMPVCFVCVRGTLRTQQVRSAHIARAAGYALIAQGSALVLFGGVGAIREVFDAWFPLLRIPVVDAILEAIYPRAWRWWPVFMVVWWWSVCRFYLRITHAVWVALLMTVMAILMVGVMLYPIATGLEFWMGFFQW